MDKTIFASTQIADEPSTFSARRPPYLTRGSLGPSFSFDFDPEAQSETTTGTIDNEE